MIYSSDILRKLEDRIAPPPVDRRKQPSAITGVLSTLETLRIRLASDPVSQGLVLLATAQLAILNAKTCRRRVKNADEIKALLALVEGHELLQGKQPSDKVRTMEIGTPSQGPLKGKSFKRTCSNVLVLRGKL